MSLRSGRRHVQQERESLHFIHQQRLREVSPVIDVSVPRSIKERKGRVDGKAIIGKFVRQRIIHQENERLSQKLEKIYTRDHKQQLDHYFDPQLDRMRRHTQACFDHRRNLQAIKTHQENAYLVARLSQAPPQIGAVAHQKFYDEKLGQMAKLRTRFRPKESYHDYVEHRKRHLESLLQSHDQTEMKRREEKRRAAMELQRQLAEQLDPETQGQWIERLLSGPLNNDDRSRSNSPDRGRSRQRDPSHPSMRPQSAGFASPVRGSGSDDGDSSERDSRRARSRAQSAQKRKRAASAGATRPSLAERQQWDSSGPQVRASRLSGSNSPSRGRPGRGERPPSRSPSKEWQTEHYIMAQSGLYYKPTAEELRARKKEAYAALKRQQKEEQEYLRQALKNSRQPSEVFLSDDHYRSLSPEAKRRLREEAQASDASLQERKRASSAKKSLTKSASQPASAFLRAKAQPGGKRMSKGELHGQSSMLGSPSRELEAILYAQDRAQEVKEQMDQEEHEARQAEIAAAREQVLEQARQQAAAEAAAAMQVPTISSSLEFTDPADRAQYQDERLIDEDLDLPEIAPPARPWRSPVALPPLQMVQAKEKEALMPDDGIMPAAQADDGEGEEEKWRGRLDWEEAMQEIPTPKISDLERERRRQAKKNRSGSGSRPSSSKNGRRSRSGSRDRSRRPSESYSRSRPESASFIRCATPDDVKEDLPDTAYLSTNISVHDLKLLLGMPLDRAESPFPTPSATPARSEMSSYANSRAHSRQNSRPQSAFGGSRPASGGHSRPQSRAGMYVSGSAAAAHMATGVSRPTSAPMNRANASPQPSSAHRPPSRAAVALAGTNSRPSSALHHPGPSITLGANDAMRFLQGSTSVTALASAAFNPTPQKERVRSPLRAVSRGTPAPLQRTPSQMGFSTYGRSLRQTTSPLKNKRRPEWQD